MTQWKKQLGKLDVIESKTINIDSKIHNIQKSVESIYGEIDSIKSKVGENQANFEKELRDFKAQQQETRKHFNAFTRHLGGAFIREQAISRRDNLIFTSIQESHNKSDQDLVRNICRSYMQISNVSIKGAFRLGSLREGSNASRPILVKFSWSIVQRFCLLFCQTTRLYGPRGVEI